MIFDEARVAALYLDLGYIRTLRPRSESILAEISSLVGLEVSDFSGFRAAVMAGPRIDRSRLK